jgi:hypothetical protein
MQMANANQIRKLPPVLFIRVLNSFRSGLLWLHRKTFPSNVVLYERFSALWLLPALRVAAEMDIAGILAEGPKSIGELAARTGSHGDSLFRLMRALASQDIFRKRKDGLFVNTPISKALIDGKGSLRYMIMQHAGTLNWSALNELSYSIRTGKPAFTKIYGKRLYDYISENLNDSNLFERSMTNLAEIAVEPVLSAVNFRKYSVIADIGGGDGFLLASILYKTPNARGILFDLPAGMKESGKILQQFGVSERVQVIPGNFLETSPAGADAYLLKNVLHNWGTSDCIRILEKIRNVMPDHARILILEMILDEGNKTSFGKMIDLQMLAFFEDGKERTRMEFETLLHQAGLKINRIIPTIAPLSVIEAVRG